MKKILINSNPWQTRIAITHDSELVNIFFSAHAQQTLERAFFKGTVTKVLPGIQTAFVDIGQQKAGFLHISEIDHELAIQNLSKHTQIEDDEPKYERRLRQKLDINKIFKEGEQILVQVCKEPVYEKGAKLTTCFTLPGRFLVLMPNIPRLGVSKKIEDRDERIRLKEIISSHLPEGVGGIIRTTAQDHGKQELIKDLNYLLKTWETIKKKFSAAQHVEKLYEDLPLSLQIVRDHLDENIEAVLVDNKNIQSTLYRFVKTIAPEQAHKIKLYTGKTNIFEYHGVEKQIDAALSKKAFLKSGGSLIIETTEAMTVIDVNTGRFTGKANLEETIFKTNMEAAEEIARQLRLRNIGGLIVIDFIDMATSANRQKLFKHFEKMIREHDKFQSVLLKISEFGLVQMTRKRSGKTLQQQLTRNCQTCSGLGFVASLQTQSYEILRKFKQSLAKEPPGEIVTLIVHPEIFEYITHTEYDAILEIERNAKTKITLLSDQQLIKGEYKIQNK